MVLIDVFLMETLVYALLAIFAAFILIFYLADHLYSLPAVLAWH